MTLLTITSKGQVTFRKALLKHLEAGPGDRLEVHLLPGGRQEVKAAAAGDIEDFIGVLAGKSPEVATVEEISAAAAEGWAGPQP